MKTVLTLGDLKYTKTDEVRFWSKVNVGQAGGCWYWRASKHPFGYGWFVINNKTYLSHRLALIFYHGRNEELLQALHECNNPSCCNPYHLKWGTPQENINDSIKAGSKTNPPVFYGENHPSARLTWLEVDNIRERIAIGESIQKIHSDYKNVSANALYRIKNFDTWKVRTE